MTSPDNHRRNTDVIKFIESEHEVTILGSCLDDIMVKFYGPKETPYEGGVWKVRVHLSEQYPFKPPKIRFLNNIIHPNISQMGQVCLDQIKHAWTEKYNLSMIFEYFLPQLLSEPNPNDSLNWCAADMYLNRPDEYKKMVSEHVQNHATEEAFQQVENEIHDI